MGLCYTALYNNTALSVFSPLSRISHRLLFTISNLFRNAVWKFQDWHLKKLMIKLPVNCRSQSKTTVLHASWLFDLWPTCLLIISNLSIFTFALVHFQIENWRIVLKKMDMCQINQYLHGSQTFSRQGPLKWHKPMTSNSHVFCNCVSYGWNYCENTFLQTSLWEPLHVLKCLHPAPVGFYCEGSLSKLPAHLSLLTSWRPDSTYCTTVQWKVLRQPDLGRLYWYTAAIGLKVGNESQQRSDWS